jgi:hypothetical protein
MKGYMAIYVLMRMIVWVIIGFAVPLATRANQ